MKMIQVSEETHFLLSILKSKWRKSSFAEVLDPIAKREVQLEGFNLEELLSNWKSEEENKS